jgi:sulfate/thiosulfate transport system permease protein
VIVLIPLAAVVVKATEASFWHVVTSPRALAALELSVGASAGQSFRRIVLPNLWPAIVSGAALAFARAVGEFGSVVLISGNIPRKTEVAPVFIFGQIESDAVASAAAVSVVLLAISLIVLVAIRRLSR